MLSEKFQSYLFLAAFLAGAAFLTAGRSSLLDGLLSRSSLLDGLLSWSSLLDGLLGWSSLLDGLLGLEQPS